MPIEFFPRYKVVEKNNQTAEYRFAFILPSPNTFGETTFIPSPPPI